jgi:hypothetical protein
MPRNRGGQADVKMTKSQFIEGLEVIRRAIILGVADVSGDIGINHFRWNHGHPFRPELTVASAHRRSGLRPASAACRGWMTLGP